MSKKRILEDWEQEECRALKKILDNYNLPLPREKRLTQLKIAEDLDITQGAVSSYLNGKNALNIEIAGYFSKKLNVPISAFSERLSGLYDELFGAHGVSEPETIYRVNEPAGPRKAPLLSSVAAGNWSEVVNCDCVGCEDTAWIEVPRNAGKNVFWLRVVGDSMTAPSGMSIPENYLILVDPDATPYNGALVVAQIDSSGEATFKKLSLDAGIYYLKPLNPSYRTIELTEKCRIIGVVKEIKLTI